MAAPRPGLGRDDSYNRVTVSRDLKSQIMSMIADSSESLPLHSVSESDEDEPASTTAATRTSLDKNRLAPPGASTGASKLSETTNAGDIPTPTPEKPNPLEQVSTVRSDSKSKSGGEGGDGGGEIFAEASPLRTHDVDGPAFGSELTKKVTRIVSRDARERDGADNEEEETDGVPGPGEKENLGTTASRATTVSAAPSTASGRKESPSGGSGSAARPGMDKRQSTMKRISSAFKRSVSKNQ